jgi:hypothetical protein
MVGTVQCVIYCWQNLWAIQCGFFGLLIRRMSIKQELDHSINQEKSIKPKQWESSINQETSFCFIDFKASRFVEAGFCDVVYNHPSWSNICVVLLRSYSWRIIKKNPIRLKQNWCVSVPPSYSSTGFGTTWMPTTIMPEEGFSAWRRHWKGEMYIVKHNRDFFFLTKHGMEVLWCRIFVHGMLSVCQCIIKSHHHQKMYRQEQVVVKMTLNWIYFVNSLIEFYTLSQRY